MRPTEKPRAIMTSYCEFVSKRPLDNLHTLHHDRVHGFAVTDDNKLFARLIMEINQAGLSWFTILKKEKNFREAYDQFNIGKVASYDKKEKERLMHDAGIIRNRLKIEAAIHNAKVIAGLQSKYGSFKAWLDHHEIHPNILKLASRAVRFANTYAPATLDTMEN